MKRLRIAFAVVAYISTVVLGLLSAFYLLVYLWLATSISPLANCTHCLDDLEAGIVWLVVGFFISLIVAMVVQPRLEIAET